jgi:PIN domain nuclease of toxin-antitoxin system
MRLLIDTHVWLRWLTTEQPLPQPMIELVENSDYLAVSAISCWEVAYLVKKDRIRLSQSLNRWLRAALHESGVDVVDISADIAVMAATLPDIHRDPADRLIIASAILADCQLMSLDERFKAYPMLSSRLIL